MQSWSSQAYYPIPTQGILSMAYLSWGFLWFEWFVKQTLGMSCKGDQGIYGI